MSKKFLTKLLAMTLCAGLILQPVTAYAEEIPEESASFEEDGPSEEVLPNPGGGETNTELPEIPNPQLNGDILSWEPMEGVGYYMVSLEAKYDYFTPDTTSTDLRAFCENRSLPDGRYGVQLTAYNISGDRISKVFITDYYYVASGSGIDDPIPELIEIPDQVLDGNILSWGFSDGIESYNLSIGSDGINIVENSRNLYELCNELGLEPGNYVVTLTGLNAAGVRVTPEYSHEYTFAPLLPEPPAKVFWVNSVDATSDLASLIASRTHSDPNIKDVFYWTEFSSTWEMYDPEKDMWEDIDSEGEAPLEAGTYRIKTYMSPAMTHVRLESDVTLTVDGQSWERKADVQDDVAWFESPTFVITDGPIIEPELPELQNVKLEGDILTWEMDPDVFTYVLELNGKYGGAVESPCDLRVFCETFELDYGEYKGTLVGRNKDNKDVTRVTKFEYDYQPEHHTLVAFLESISGSSDFDEIDADKLFRYPTLTSETEDVSLHNMYYEKLLDDGTWRSTGFGTNQPFAPGTYRCKINAEIAREHYSDTAFWADKVELLMDGTPWTYGGPLGWNGDYCVAVTFYSPLIIVEEEKPVDPDDITGGRFYVKWGATYYETEEGELLQGLKKIDGDYYFFNKNGTMKKDVNITIDGKTYYFDKSGKRYNGLLTKWGATYYFNDEMIFGFAEIDGNTYYFRPNTGAMVKDQFISADGHTFYLKPDGTLAKNETITRWSVMHQFDENGHLIRSGRW